MIRLDPDDHLHQTTTTTTAMTVVDDDEWVTGEVRINVGKRGKKGGLGPEMGDRVKGRKITFVKTNDAAPPKKYDERKFYILTRQRAERVKRGQPKKEGFGQHGTSVSSKFPTEFRGGGLVKKKMKAKGGRRYLVLDTKELKE